MIANIVNTLIGLWLTYVAIFAQPSGGAPRWALSAAALAIVLLAIAARRSDFSGWQSATNIVLGAVLIIVAAVNWVAALPPLLMFWVELWIGLAVATFALWAVLHHPERQRTGDGSI